MSDTHSAVRDFVREFWVEPTLPSGDVDLFGELGIDGDDASEFMDTFVAKFDVEADNYRWYFHHGEEGHNLGGAFFAPPYRRVNHIPVTLNILIKAVETKKWPIIYPEHELPKVRWDIRFNQIFALVTFGALLIWLWYRFVD